MAIKALANAESGQFLAQAPSTGAVQLNPVDVGLLAEAYRQEADDYVFNRALPYVGVPNLEFSYPRWDKGQTFGVRMADLADGAAIDVVGRDVEKITERLTVRGLAARVTDDARANNTTGRALTEENVDLLMQAFWNTHEQAFVDTIFKAGVWTTDAPTENWSAPGFDIIKSLNTASETILSRGGRGRDLVGICNNKVANLLRRNTGIRSALRFGTSAGSPVLEMGGIARSVGLREIYVGSAVKSNGNRFLADDFLVLSAPASKTMNTPSAAFLAGWTGTGGGAPNGVATRLWRDDQHLADEIQIKTSYGMYVQAADLGYRIPSVTS